MPAAKPLPFRATRRDYAVCTQVGILGTGPARLLLSHLLHLNGIASVVLEARCRTYVEGRIRYPFGWLGILSDVGPSSEELVYASHGRGFALLTRALIGYFRTGATDPLDAYGETCLRRVWKTRRFSWWMTGLLHRFAEHRRFERQVQRGELDYLSGSAAASTALAENYVGLPY